MENDAVDLLEGPLIAINVGVQDFGDALEGQGVPVIFVEWQPPAGGDQEIIDLLDDLL
jgi:FdrA protein